MTRHVFKVGDRVRISKQSEWYVTTGDYQSRVNPKDVTGVVISGSVYIKVKWPECASNSYLPSDLVHFGVLSSTEFDDENKRKEIL